MDLIYRRASLTTVCIGDEADNSRSIMMSLGRLGSSMTFNSNDPETWAPFKELWRPGFWRALEAFSNRPLWTRMWILQEIALSQAVTICCGDAELPWPDLRLAQERLSDLSWNEPWKHFSPNLVRRITSSSHVRLATFARARKLFRERGTDNSIFTMLYNSLELQCSDPRDKIYAVLGMARSDSLLMTPDYSMSVGDVFTIFQSSELARGADLGVLHLSGSGMFLPEHRTCELPSWVCDWTAWATAESDMSPTYRPLFWLHAYRFKAGRLDCEPTITTIPGSPILTTSGVRCGSIVDCFPNDPFHQHAFWQHFMPADHPCTKKYPTGIPVLQAVFRTFLLDTDREKMIPLEENRDLLTRIIFGFIVFLHDVLSHQREPESTNDLLEDEATSVERAWLYLCNEIHNSRSEGEQPSLTLLNTILGDNWKDLDFDSIDSATDYYVLGANRCNYARHSSHFFETEQGHFGLGPVGTRSCDELYVLPGLACPFVMRRHGDGDHEMVGPCFVLGYMDGEAMDFLESGERQLENLTIH